MTDDAKGMPERIAVDEFDGDNAVAWDVTCDGADELTPYVLASKFTALEAENERLRKALDDLSTRCDCNELCACASDMMATAREALTPKPSLSTPNPEREEGGR